MKWKEMTLQDLSENISNRGKHKSWLYSQVRQANRIWNKNLRNYPCQVCQYSKHVELAHIKAITSFEPITLLTTINHPSNILVLCPTHHWEFDNKILDLNSIIPIENLIPNIKQKEDKRTIRNKIIWPEDNHLENLVWTIPIQKLAKQLGVSDSAIIKRCNRRKISKPPRGYWLLSIER